MTRRRLAQEPRLLKVGDPISAKWLNAVASRATTRAERAQSEQREKPAGEDGENSAASLTLTEIPGTAIWGATHRIEDASDPNVYIEYRNKIEILMLGSDDGLYVFRFFDETPPP